MADPAHIITCPVTITGWKDMFYCISPYSWAYMGVALALGLSIIGAAWYLFRYDC